MTEQDKREAVAEAFFNFTAKQGWKLAGFEREIYEKGFEFADQILSLLTPELKVLSDARSIIEDLVDAGDCDLDHHGYCQAHGWLLEGLCPHFRAKMFLLNQLDKDRNENKT